MLKNMPWTKDSKGNEDDAKEEHSLTSILKTPEERAELTILIGNCTESMRNTINDAFDPQKVGETSDVSLDASKTGVSRDPQSLVDNAEAEVAAEERDKKTLHLRTIECEKAENQTLKKAALEHFDNWRDSVILRLGEVINAKDDTTKQDDDASSSTASAKPKVDPNPEHNKDVAHALHQFYPAVETKLKNLPVPQRGLILHSILLLLLSLEQYSAYSRTLLQYVLSSLAIAPEVLAKDEQNVARGLLDAASHMSADDETQKKAASGSMARKLKVGAAGLGGAVLIGVTGGLAAPLLAAGIGTVMGGLGLGATAAAGYLGALASSGVLVGSLFGAYGAAMTGKMMDQYAKEVSDFRFLPVPEPSRFSMQKGQEHRLRVAIGISGWLTDQADITKPWLILSPSIETFALRWEVEALIALGNSMSTFLKSAAWSVAKSEIIKHTVFAALTAGLWAPLAIVKASKIVDNPFSVAKSRSEKAGEVLADALINRCQGQRPVTLIGYSLGARVIYSCLAELAKRKAFGLIESVVLVGAPTPSDSENWRRIRSVVTGRVVNVYSTQDYVLAFLYRTSSVQLGVAGLQKIVDVRGVQNVDVSSLVTGHLQYRHLTGSVLREIGFEDVDAEAVKKEEVDMKKEEQERKREQEETQATQNGAEVETEKLEQEVQEKNEASLPS